MTRKSITTTHKPVACDMCGRSLLRGEHPQAFISGDSRQLVCELCALRAAHEGWIREGLDDSLRVPLQPNAARGRSLLGRLRQLREPPPPEQLEDHDAEPGEAFAEALAPQRPAPRRRRAPARAPEPAPAPVDTRSVHAVPTNADLKVARAVELFNASEHTRTVAGVSRSLGPPFAAVHPSGSTGRLVSIVIAWELCWYRYEVDLADADGVRLAAQGDELSDLELADSAPNAAADERGELELAAA